MIGSDVVPCLQGYYGQSKSASRGTVSVPFFSEWTQLKQIKTHIHADINSNFNANVLTQSVYWTYWNRPSWGKHQDMLMYNTRALEQGLQYSNIQISQRQYSGYPSQYSIFKYLNVIILCNDNALSISFASNT